MKLLQPNPFFQPRLAREQILAEPLVTADPSRYMGKSIVYVFFTRHCGVGCPFCFFKSPPPNGEVTIADEMNDEGISKYIDFCNEANVGYLGISGGGEPLNHRQATLRSLKEIECHRIVMNTSGSWAMSEQAARKYLGEMANAIENRKKPAKVVVRLSVSSGHSIKLGIKPALHLIRIFQTEYRDHPYFEFQLHGFKGDPTLQRINEALPGSQFIDWIHNRTSADDQVVKYMPERCLLLLNDGFRITTGITRIFISDLRPNLHNFKDCAKRAKIFMEDLCDSEDFYPTVVQNQQGIPGIDWAFNYNGNICAWTNQVNDNQLNIYQDNYKKVLETTFRDPLMLSIIEKGTIYRDRVVAEADPLAVRRLRAISLRDFSGTILFEEEKTRLYYTLRVLQDYRREGRWIADASLPEPLQTLIEGTKEDLLRLFHQADYTIIDQQKAKGPFQEQEWKDLLELIRLGHYNLTENQISEALDYFNSHSQQKQYDSLADIESEQGRDIEKRLTDRLMFIKPSILEPLLC